MKVAMITHNYPPKVNGGGEISCKLLVDTLQKKGIDVDVFSGEEMFSKPNATIKTLQRMYSFLRKKKDEYDIFHVYNMDYLPTVGILSKKYKINSVATLNGIKYSNYMMDKENQSFLKKVRNNVLIFQYIKHISHFTTLCPMYKNMWEHDGIPSEKITVIPNMLDPSFKVEKQDHKNFNVLFVGNKAWWRDFNTVEVIGGMDEVRMIAVGKGGKFSKNVENFSCSNEDIKKVYAIADVLIAPYLLPLPISRCIIEAMQTRIPVVTTGGQQWSPVIEDEKSGLLTENHLFRYKVLELKHHKEIYQSISENSKKRVNEVCHPDVIVEHYKKIYEELK